jgi:hypothetical protein
VCGQIRRTLEQFWIGLPQRRRRCKTSIFDGGKPDFPGKKRAAALTEVPARWRSKPVGRTSAATDSAVLQAPNEYVAPSDGQRPLLWVEYQSVMAKGHHRSLQVWRMIFWTEQPCGPLIAVQTAASSFQYQVPWQRRLWGNPKKM